MSNNLDIIVSQINNKIHPILDSTFYHLCKIHLLVCLILYIIHMNISEVDIVPKVAPVAPVIPIIPGPVAPVAPVAPVVPVAPVAPGPKIKVAPVPKPVAPVPKPVAPVTPGPKIKVTPEPIIKEKITKLKKDQKEVTFHINTLLIDIFDEYNKIDNFRSHVLHNMAILRFIVVICICDIINNITNDKNIVKDVETFSQVKKLSVFSFITYKDDEIDRVIKKNILLKNMELFFLFIILDVDINKICDIFISDKTEIKTKTNRDKEEIKTKTNRDKEKIKSKTGIPFDKHNDLRRTEKSYSDQELIMIYKLRKSEIDDIKLKTSFLKESFIILLSIKYENLYILFQCIYSIILQETNITRIFQMLNTGAAAFGATNHNITSNGGRQLTNILDDIAELHVNKYLSIVTDLEARIASLKNKNQTFNIEIDSLTSITKSKLEDYTVTHGELVEEFVKIKQDTDSFLENYNNDIKNLILDSNFIKNLKSDKQPKPLVKSRSPAPKLRPRPESPIFSKRPLPRERPKPKR